MITEAEQYWTLVNKFRHGPSLIERQMDIGIEIPAFYDEVKSPHIRIQLSNLMDQEGIFYAETQSSNPSC